MVLQDAVRDCWVQWMAEERPLTAAGNLQQPKRQDIINWVGRAWDSVRGDTITKAFLRCAVSNALDGTEDDQTLEWFPEEIMPALPRGAADASESDASATGSSSHDSSLSDSD